MTIKIYPGQMPSQPIEEHAWSGTIGAWFDTAGIDYAAQEVQPVSVLVNGRIIASEDWGATEVGYTDVVEISPIPRADPLTWLYVAVAVFAVASYVMRPKIPGSRSSQQGQNLSTAEGSANVSKPNAVVPELLGRYRRYPDYIVQPRRYFENPRTQYLEMLLCIGPGRYEVERVQVGDTDFVALDGFEYRLYEPGANLSAEPAAQNWYGVSEVGGTSAGTAGLELTSIADRSLNPTGSSFTFTGGGWISCVSPFPSAWGQGTNLSLVLLQEFDITLETIGQGIWSSQINRFHGDWREQNPTIGAQYASSMNFTVRVRAMSLDENKVGWVEFEYFTTVSDGEGGTTEGWAYLRSAPVGLHRAAFSVPGRRYVVESYSDNHVNLQAVGVAGWLGFASGAYVASHLAWIVDGTTVYGESAGPFAVCPVSEATSVIEVDFLFPQGLAYINDDGDVQSRSVGVEIGWRPVPGGIWSSRTVWYTQATLDQIGFTEHITVPSGRYEVRIRRRGARSTSTQVQDTIQWYGLRSLLPTPASYPWTTMAVRIKGLGQIAASSESQINVIATRKLPTLQPDGTWGPEVATRDISAALGYIAASNLDMPEVKRLHELWRSRGETLDFVFDETTVAGALDTTLAAGMAEKTLEDGHIKPVREGVRTVFEHGYSAQNTLDGIKRAFNAPRPDDHDGVEVEYVDADDSWATKTVVCKLPDSLGVKLEKLKLDGVTSRTRAYRIGMRRASQKRYSRWSYTFSTEMDALNSSYGSYVPLITDVPGFGQSAILTHITGSQAAAVLTASEPLQWQEGQPHVIALRRPDGTTAGPWPATPGESSYTVHVTGIRPADWPEVTLSREPPHVYFGPSTRWTHPALITEIRPQGMDSVAVTAKNYDAREYAYDDASPAD